MISNNFEDYEVLTILGVTTYKVQNKDTGKIFLWKAVTFEKASDIEAIVKQIEKQKAQVHPNLVEIYDYIIKEDIGVIYVIIEYLCYGTLNSIKQRCLSENKYLHEHFLWKVLYQLAATLKSSMITYVDLNNIFVDADFNIKVFKDDAKETEKTKIGRIMLSLSTLQSDKDNSEVLSYYSNEFKEVVKFTILETYSTKEIVDAILCHPTILYKSSQVPQIYVQNTEVKSVLENETNHEAEDIYQTRLRNLRNHERTLKMQEDKLLSKEHELKKREKKLAIMERTVKEKLLHAEVYLKRCRETKASSMGSSKKCDDLNSTISAACESLVAATSKKLNPSNIKKPSNFTRSLSQHRVHFKGHSPLKEKFGKNSKCNNDGIDGVKTNGCSKKKMELFSTTMNKNKKPLSDQNVQLEKKTEYIRPISWCGEAKQHAFELLRFMNEKENLAVKHTYL
ncbi:hypothetical protein RN001_009908 [Aquatica leii]|uniref:Protein kinase domain-containing protein n=1 Tax=Aquatica leii TaxID=1421715 RepID=A0AAN7PVU8_9COLE|nr:hypothetical protein RN001_009908 [Aquatica leii]